MNKHDGILIVATIKPGHADAIRVIVAEGPPFDLEQSSLERHMVFVGDSCVAFMFEGRDGMLDRLRMLARHPGVLHQMMRIAEHLDGMPAQPDLAFCWTRPPTADDSPAKLRE